MSVTLLNIAQAGENGTGQPAAATTGSGAVPGLSSVPQPLRCPYLCPQQPPVAPADHPNRQPRSENMPPACPQAPAPLLPTSPPHVQQPCWLLPRGFGHKFGWFGLCRNHPDDSTTASTHCAPSPHKARAKGRTGQLVPSLSQPPMPQKLPQRPSLSHGENEVHWEGPGPRS